ncbi:MAG: phage terminase large subunit family protein, partial [Planctomycetes bacterium]|nr:phage terminase large subunit family protein [Planctomycetota bacterium]
QVIRWGNIVYKDDAGNDDLDNIYMRCENCQGKIDESYKTQMLEECTDYDNPKAKGARWIAENPDARHPSFHLSSLYSPLGFYSWVDAVELWLKAERNFDKEMLKVFINTVLGETFSEAGKSIESSYLEKRKEEYPAPVPQDGLVLTIGGDIQDDRIEVETVAWGLGLESWSVDYSVFMGDTERDFVWDQLDKYLLTTWKHESGTEMRSVVSCLDSGYRTAKVYKFCRKREFRGVFPVKGDSGWGKGYLDRPQRRNKEGVYPFRAFVDEIKSKIYSDLQVTERGPGFCHFPRKAVYNSHYFRMLTAERLITSKRTMGQRKLMWDCPKGRRNEALDCRCYAIAALTILNPNLEVISKQGKPLASRTPAAPRKKVKRISKGVQ